MEFEKSRLILAYELLAPFVDVVPASAAADAEEMNDRDCHVAAAMNGQVSSSP
jgi:hypothetical protein